MSRSLKRIVPAAGRCIPAMVRMSGLAGTIRADNGDDGALRHLQRHFVESLCVAVEDVDVVDEQHQSASAPR